MRYDPNRFPFLWYDICPDCDYELVAIVEQTIGTPKATGGLMRVPFEPNIVWMQKCDHIEDWQEELD